MRASTSRFTLHNKCFVAEHSELSHGGRGLVFHQIYDDACDVGLVLVSHRTGHEATYYVHEEKRQEGELVVWILLPTSETLRKHPQLRGTEVHILND